MMLVVFATATILHALVAMGSQTVEVRMTNVGYAMVIIQLVLDVTAFQIVKKI
jgi:hypothetical protein